MLQVIDIWLYSLGNINYVRRGDYWGNWLLLLGFANYLMNGELSKASYDWTKIVLDSQETYTSTIKCHYLNTKWLSFRRSLGDSTTLPF